MYQEQLQQMLLEDEEIIRGFFNAITETMVLMDTGCKILDINSTGAERLGGTPETLIGRNLNDLVPPEVAAQRIVRYNRVVREKGPIRFSDFRNGMYLDHSVYPIFNSSGQVVKLAVFVQNVTERVRAVESLRENEERFRSAFEDAAIGMALVSVDRHVIKINRSLCEIIGYTEKELLNKDFRIFTHPEDIGKDLENTALLLSGAVRTYTMEKRYIHKKGYLVWGLLSVSLVRNSKGEPMYFVSQVQDITQRKHAEEELQKAKLEAEKAREHAEYLASTDYLTGVLNRRAFIQRLNSEYERAERHGTPFSLVLADIDRFKKVNDTYGHQAGDLVLQEFARCLSSHCRPYDFVGRHGGEEFIVCLPDTDCIQAEKAAERMREAVQKLTVAFGEQQTVIRFTSSFGISSIVDAPNDSVDAVIGRADTALYKAKTMGRNRVCSDCAI